MRVGIPTETQPGERRVAATPETVGKLIGLGFEVRVQAGAGTAARLMDADYAEAGAQIVDDAAALWADSDIVLKVRSPQIGSETDLLREGGWLISLIQPATSGPLIEALAARKATVIALDQIPRISRAQKMDVLSSMANIAGYRAIIEAANHFGSLFGGQITAAGRSRPAQVLVIGAGVAGLAAVAAARGLGAQVRAFDVRPAVKEQVESLGATFLELEFDSDEEGETKGGYAKTMSKEFIEAEMALFAEQAREVDIIVTTALIPGKKAPVLITKEMVDSMRPGGVVVDLAAEQGGNCGYTQANEIVEVGGVTVLGYTDLTSRLPTHASQMFGTNLVNLLSDMTRDGEAFIDLDDEVVRKSLILHDGKVTWPPPPDPKPEPVTAPIPTDPPPAEPEPAVPNASSTEGAESGPTIPWPLLIGAAVAVVLMWLGLDPEFSDFVQHLTVFVLACFVGWQVVWNVTAALHTPLMSVTNAISGIIVVGGLIQAGTFDGGDPWALAPLLGAVAILVASINIAGGFLVTQRMLQMFRKG